MQYNLKRFEAPELSIVSYFTVTWATFTYYEVTMLKKEVSMAEQVHRVREVHDDDHMVGVPVFFARLIYFVFGVIIAFIFMRFLLLLLAANQGNAFVDVVYGISGVFVAPFYGIFGYTPTFGASVFDISSLVAMIVYALVAWALVSLVMLGSRDRSEEV